MKKLFLFSFLYLFCFGAVQAQSSVFLYSVKGQVQDKKGEPLPFATVLVISALDSSLVKGDVTDIDGNFQIELKKEGSFRLQTSMVGYEQRISPVFQLNANNPSIQLPYLVLEEASATLQEVQVVAKKPFIEQKIDRTVLNVENSIVSSGSTALEILERAPGVTIDSQNDQIRLRNKSGVLFMIDGKRTFLSEADLAQMLRNMTSDQIESVEIITNPSSKYDAAGNSGIINIKLKKNQQVGTNGTFTLGAGNGFIPNAPKDLSRYNSSLQVNHRTKKLNMFANVSANRNLFYSDNTLNRRVAFENVLTTFDQLSQRVQTGKAISFKTGLDYTINDKTSIGILMDGSDWAGELDGSNATHIQGFEKSSLDQLSKIDMIRKNLSSSLQVKHAFNKKGKELTFDVDYSRFEGDNTQNFETNFFDAQNNPTNQLFQRNFTPTYINIFTAKTDYTLPINEKTKWEIGAKTAYVQTDNNFVFEQLMGTNWTNDPTKTNYFKYTEFVNAGYINYSQQWEKIGIQAGLRAEHTQSLGNSVTLDEKLERNYLSLFPTLFINHTLSKNHATRYSYSRRIDRPNYGQLNPFVFYLDPYTYEEGNPNLQPQFTDNIELTYTYKGGLSFGLSYANTRDFMIQITEQDDATSVTRAIQRNLQRFQNYSFNVVFPYPIAKWWNTQNQGNLYYSAFTDDSLLGGQLQAGQVAYNFNTSHQFTLPKQWSAELSMWYNSPSIYGIFRNVKPQYAVNMGIQKSFMNKKARLKLNVSDLFLTSFWYGQVNYQNMDFNISSRFTSRRATLTFTYNFGNQQVKVGQRRQSAAELEKSRIGGQN